MREYLNNKESKYLDNLLIQYVSLNSIMEQTKIELLQKYENDQSNPEFIKDYDTLQKETQKKSDIIQQKIREFV